MQACYFAAIARIPVGVALLIEFLGPVLVLGWLRFVRREPLTRSAIVGVALAVGGLACVVEIWSGLSFDPIGLLLALAAAGCQATFFLLSHSSAEVDPRALTAYGLLGAAAVMSVLSRPWRIDWSVLTENVELGGFALPGLFAVGWLAAASAVLAYITGIAAVRTLTPSVAGGVAFLEPVVATALAWLLVGERMGPVQMFGGAMVLIGAYVAQRAAPGRASDVDRTVAGPTRSDLEPRL